MASFESEMDELEKIIYNVSCEKSREKHRLIYDRFLRLQNYKNEKMGLFSESHAKVEADNLEKVLLEAINENESKVNIFCKKFILPMYVNAIAESFGEDTFNYKLIEKYFSRI